MGKRNRSSVLVLLNTAPATLPHHPLGSEHLQGADTPSLPAMEDPRATEVRLVRRATLCTSGIRFRKNGRIYVGRYAVSRYPQLNHTQY